MQQSIKNKGDQNIKVFARIRPFNDKENQAQCCIHSLTDNFIAIKQKDLKQPHNFTFDGIFPMESTQSEIYNAVGAEIVSSAFDGLNGTIFCYGQTSSGKTFTCIGPDFRSETNSGILPRLIKQTLARIQQRPKNLQIKMKISMVQIYNEKIKDLLDQSKTDLKIRSNKKQGIFLQNITQKYVLSEEEAFSYLSVGIQSRSVSFTNMNSQSSRSHMVFIINLNVHDIYSAQAKSAKMILVDLAGSQKISKTGAQGKVLEEAKKINTSLTALGKVINALSDGKSTHVPYRDSKLTRLLQQSLGGNSLTNLVVNVSPSSYNQLQTLSTFRFGQRAKSIKNQPVVNKCYTVEQLLIILKKAQQTIQKQSLLIKQLSNKKRSGGYGALSIPSNITLHMINDQQSTSKSIQLDNEDSDIESANQEQSQTQILKSEQTLKLNLQKHKRLRQHRTNTWSSWTQSKQEQIITKFQKIQKKSDQRLPLSQNYDSQKKVIKKNLCLAGLQNLPSIIHEDSQQNTQTPRNLLGQTNQAFGFCEMTQTQHNLDKIRQNLFQLKMRYMQQKRENSIKTMIIQRKNKIIEKAKNTKLLQMPR